MSTYQQSLAAFLAHAENNETELALAVGKTQAAINRYRNGKRFPDAETARLIDAHTRGQVAFATWQTDFMARSGLLPTRERAA